MFCILTILYSGVTINTIQSHHKNTFGKLVSEVIYKNKFV